MSPRPACPSCSEFLSPCYCLPDCSGTEGVLPPVPMSSANKRPRSERLAARSLLGASQQPTNGASAVAPHNNEANTQKPTAAPGGGTRQATAPLLTPAAGAMDTNKDLLAQMQICAQVLDLYLKHRQAAAKVFCVLIS